MAFATKGVLHELKRRQEKEKAVRLLNENGIPMELEKMLNIMAVERPQDVFGRMAEHFQELARPAVISRLTGRTTYDSCFNKALHLDLFCVINGREKTVTSFSTSLQEVSKGHNSTDADTTSQENIAPLDGYIPDVILDAISVVLKGIEPGSQKDIDDRLSSVEVANRGEMFAVSSICARAAASLKGIPTIRHLADIYHKKDAKFSLPYLVCPVLCSGMYGLGKLKIHQFCVTPLPAVCFTEQVDYMKKFHAQFRVVLKDKFGSSAHATTTHGHCVVLDKVEQPFELISEAVSSCGLELGKHIGIIVYFNGSSLYNREKDKYEVISGQLKTADEMVSLVENTVCSYPGVVGVVEPFICDDPIPWQKLHKSIGQRCYIVSGHSEWVTNQKEDLEAINCVTLNPALTLTKTIDGCLYCETITKAVLFDVQDETTTSLLEILADLVVMSRCRFVRIPYFKDITSVFISHLLNTRETLISVGFYDICGAHNYSCKEPKEEQQS